MASFKIVKDTPEADKLERRIHAQLKELWEPGADSTAAKYIVGMLTKGYDRKKMQAQLKGIMGEATGTVLDWCVGFSCCCRAGATFVLPAAFVLGRRPACFGVRTQIARLRPACLPLHPLAGSSNTCACTRTSTGPGLRRRPKRRGRRLPRPQPLLHLSPPPRQRSPR